MKLSRMIGAYTWPQGDDEDAERGTVPFYVSTFPREVDPGDLIPPCKHKHRTSTGALSCSRKRQDAMGVGSDGRNTFPVLVCGGCGHPIYHEAGVGLVSAVSGDDGGTYDICDAGGTHKREES